MTIVIAAIDGSAVGQQVMTTAAAVAPLFGATVEAVHVCDETTPNHLSEAEAWWPGELRRIDGPVVPSLVDVVDRSEVAAVVVGASGQSPGTAPPGHVALEIMRRISKPVIVVPPAARAPAQVRRMLVPLDGSLVTSAALRRVVELARLASVELLALHVHDLAALPMFTDQPQHEMREWSEEFLRRYAPCDEREVHLHVRAGVPAEEVARFLTHADVDLVVIGWTRTYAPGRAHVVRALIERGGRPILLVPTSRAASRSSPWDAASAGVEDGRTSVASTPTARQERGR
jgi:nucleotide-binding universal stress UspA family protein